MCHGVAGAEDRPQYATPTVTETPGVTINFRTMLHKIHMGADLTNAATYEVNGFGGPTTFDEIHFPAMPEGVRQCNLCHGDSDAWTEPSLRNHPTDQTLPAREYRAVCASCHDSNAVAAHADVMTSGSGFESCEVCHGPGGDFEVPLAHKVHF